MRGLVDNGISQGLSIDIARGECNGRISILISGYGLIDDYRSRIR